MLYFSSSLALASNNRSGNDFKPESCPNNLWEICYFLYLTNKVEFEQDILQDCVLSYRLVV
jgi:hypothetical protein